MSSLGLTYIPPIKRHSGLGVRISQKFGDKSNIAFYVSNGIAIPYHNGTDYVLGLDPRQSYGSELPALADGVVVKIQYDTPLSTKGNGITVQTPIRTWNGEEYQSYYTHWHCSKIVKAVGDQVKKGETVAYLGNSGAVFPSPTPENPYNGTHDHVMCWCYKRVGDTWVLLNKENGVGGAHDPMDHMLDLYNDALFGNSPRIEERLLPFQDLIDIIKSKVEALIKLLRK